MLKQSIESLVSKIAEQNAYDPRLDPKGTGWYFPGQWDEATPDPLTLEGEGSYLDSDAMLELIEQGIAETEREAATVTQELASTALSSTVAPPSSSEN